MTGRGDARLEAALLERALRTPADVVDLLAPARAALGTVLTGHEYALHVVLHRLVRAGALAVVGTSARGLALYGASAVPGGATAGFTPRAGPDDPVAHHVARAVRDPAAQGRVAHDVAAHRAALAAEQGPEHVEGVFGSARAARALFKRVDRGHRTVVVLTGAGDTLLRLLVHEGPWLVGSLLLFLVVKFFLADVFVIPSDSMVPTLIQRDRVVVTRRWPGWVPDRWQIVTFRHYHPKDGPNATWVKRVVGLPGEEFSVWHGDLYANGALLVKPDDVNAGLRARVRDWSFAAGTRLGWSVEGSEAGVDEWLPPADVLPSTLAPGEGLLDLYVELDADVPARGACTLHLGRSAGDGTTMTRVDWHLEAGRDGLRLTETTTGNKPVTELWREPAPLTGRVTLRLAVVDGIVRASVGERTWRGARDMPADRASFQFSTTDGAQPLALRLDKDLHYSDDGSIAVRGKGNPPSRSPSDHRHPIPAGHVFFMGDNTLVSQDSRFSEVGDISVQKLIGPVVFRLWPLNRVGGVH